MRSAKNETVATLDSNQDYLGNLFEGTLNKPKRITKFLKVFGRLNDKKSLLNDFFAGAFNSDGKALRAFFTPTSAKESKYLLKLLKTLFATTFFNIEAEPVTKFVQAIVRNNAQTKNSNILNSFFKRFVKLIVNTKPSKYVGELIFPAIKELPELIKLFNKKSISSCFTSEQLAGLITTSKSNIKFIELVFGKPAWYNLFSYTRYGFGKDVSKADWKKLIQSSANKAMGLRLLQIAESHHGKKEFSDIRKLVESNSLFTTQKAQIKGSDASIKNFLDNTTVNNIAVFGTDYSKKTFTPQKPKPVSDVETRNLSQTGIVETVISNTNIDSSVLKENLSPVLENNEAAQSHKQVVIAETVISNTNDISSASKKPSTPKRERPSSDKKTYSAKRTKFDNIVIPEQATQPKLDNQILPTQVTYLDASIFPKQDTQDENNIIFTNDVDSFNNSLENNDGIYHTDELADNTSDVSTEDEISFDHIKPTFASKVANKPLDNQAALSDDEDEDEISLDHIKPTFTSKVANKPLDNQAALSDDEDEISFDHIKPTFVSKVANKPLDNQVALSDDEDEISLDHIKPTFTSKVANKPLDNQAALSDDEDEISFDHIKPTFTSKVANKPLDNQAALSDDEDEISFDHIKPAFVPKVTNNTQKNHSALSEDEISYEVIQAHIKFKNNIVQNSNSSISGSDEDIDFDPTINADNAFKRSKEVAHTSIDNGSTELEFNLDNFPDDYTQFTESWHAKTSQTLFANAMPDSLSAEAIAALKVEYMALPDDDQDKIDFLAMYSSLEEQAIDPEREMNIYSNPKFPILDKAKQDHFNKLLEDLFAKKLQESENEHIPERPSLHI